MKIEYNEYIDVDYEDLIKIISEDKLKLCIENYITENKLWEEKEWDDVWNIGNGKEKTKRQLWEEKELEYIFDDFFDDFIADDKIELMQYIAEQLSTGNELWSFYYDDENECEVLQQTIVTNINYNNLIALMKDGIDNGLVVYFEQLKDDLEAYQLQHIMTK